MSMADDAEKNEAGQAEGATKVTKVEAGETGQTKVGSAKGKGAGSKDAETATAAPKTVKPGARRPVVLVAVVLCSLIMVVSVLLPSLSAIISGVQTTVEQNSSSSTEASSTEAASTEAATTEATTTNTMIETLDTRYSSATDKLEAKLAESPDDAATLINLANDYYSWAGSVMSYAETDDEQAHVTDLFGKARDYYDQYLENNSASAAKANRAMCLYYLDDANTAVEELAELVSEDSSYAPAWVYLGEIYEANDLTDEATEAYNQALSADPDDKYGMQSSVSSRLSSLTASTDEAATGDSSSDSSTTE